MTCIIGSYSFKTEICQLFWFNLLNTRSNQNNKHLTNMAEIAHISFTLPYPGYLLVKNKVPEFETVFQMKREIFISSPQKNICCEFSTKSPQYLSLKIYRIHPNYSTCSYKRTVKQFLALQIKTTIILSGSFITAFVVGTLLNCIDKSRQFKRVPTTYAFINLLC